MKLEPRYSKYKKLQKGKKQNLINKGTTSLDRLPYGQFALVSTEAGFMTAKQIDTMRQTLNKVIKKNGTFLIYLFPFTPVTNKPLEVRMGKGKGNIAYRIAKIKAGTKLCEINTNVELIGSRALKLLQYKLPINTKVLYNY